jgi:hypothetical protein
MPLSLEEMTDGGFDYPEKVEANFAAIESFVNALAQQVLAVSGDGADLILDTYDRPGLIGTHSYVLDTDAYSGGAEIVIGRRPAPSIPSVEFDISAAWGTWGGERQRVQQPGDVTLDAAPILNALPKTIYVGIPSSGTAQLFEDDTTPEVLYIYSMTWNGFNLTNFKRMGHHLPAYSLFQSMVKHAQVVQISDWETQWTGDLVAEMSLPLHGGPLANEIGVNHAVEVIGGFVDVPRAGAGRFHSPSAIKNKLVLKLMAAGVKWNTGTLEINVASCPDRIYFTIDEGAVGDDRFVTDVEDFRLERVSIGEHVVSARGYTLGLFVRPLLGMAIPKDNDSVEQI